jgi:hypothetical protein
VTKPAAPAGASPSQATSHPSRARPSRRSPPRLADLDLRPTFVRPGWLENAPASEPSVPSQAAELAATRFQVTSAFDKLALQVSKYLDFPEILMENGVQGTAAIDLRFDSEGRVDETRSTWTGSHRAVRGLLVQATRLGLVEWYESDAYRLHRDEFRNQHFQAAFEITYTQAGESRIDQTGPGSYQMLRRRQKQVCAHPGGIELVCLARKTQGAVENLLIDKGRILYEMLRDKLDRFDEQGLQGVNQQIQGG